jgi:transposase
MDLTSRNLLLQFGHMLQQVLFPAVEAETGPLSRQLQLVTSVVSLVPLERLLSARRSWTGRPPTDRAALATAFIAKAVLNLPTTRDLIGRLQADDALRRLCGWASAEALPHESKFSRAFAEFAETELVQQLHAAVIEATQRERLIGHIARDSTAIPVRERYPETAAQKEEKEKRKKEKKEEERKRAKAKEAGRKGAETAKGGSGKQAPATPGAKREKGRHQRAKAADRGTRIQRQRHQELDVMLKDLPRQCDRGAKTNSQGNEQYWRGFKLHLDVADGQLPISAVLTSASVHDSQVAIPLMAMTSGRVTHLYELMDSAYDAESIHEHSRQLNHVPIIAVHPRRGTKKPSQMQKVFPDKPTPQLTPAQQQRFKTRTMVERVNARLKDEFGASQIRVRGGAKVMAHLMFGVLALTVDQWLRLAATG